MRQARQEVEKEVSEKFEIEAVKEESAGWVREERRAEGDDEDQGSVSSNSRESRASHGPERANLVEHGRHG